MKPVSSLVLLIVFFLAGCARPQSAPRSDNAINQSTPAASPTSTPTPQPTAIQNAEIWLANGLRLVPKKITLENERRRYKIDVTFPQIEGSKDPAFSNLNRNIRNLATKQYAWLLVPPTRNDLRQYENWPGVYNSLVLDYYVVLATNRFLSLYLDVYSYGVGAAHSVQQSFTINFDMTTKTRLSLDSLFRPGTQPLQFISKYCINELSQAHPSINDLGFRDNVVPVWKNFASWNIVPQGIRINFDACRIDGCAAGTLRVVIPFAELKSLLRPQFADSRT